jgi:hypothetical protein
LKLFLCLFIFVFSFGAWSITWEKDSDPRIMGEHFYDNFYVLPKSGRVFEDSKFWSGSYWPLNKGNINLRWHAKIQNGFHLSSPIKTEALQMREEEIAELSPAEKYDLYMGRYDYPLTLEVSRLAKSDAKDWEGICHGWAPASMNHYEPKPKIMLNAQGIKIPFGSSDIKALISYYYANGFVAPEEVWNQPIMGYSTTILGKISEQRLKVRTSIYFVTEAENSWNSIRQTPANKFEHRDYTYFLDLDSDYRIIGGSWLGDRPDFLWLKERAIKFDGIYYRLYELLDD